MSRIAGRGAALALALLAWALRLLRLGDQNVWWDEALAIWVVRKPLVGATLWTAGDVHPPLYFWMLWGWVRLVGESELASRALSAGLGVVTAVVAYALARRLAGRAAALLALALVATSRLSVWWSMELRMYVLAGAAVMLATYATVRWAGAAGRAGRRWLAAYVAAGLSAVLTIYLAGIAVAVLNLAVLAAAAGRRVAPRRYAAWLAANVGLVALFLPWWALASGRMQSWTSIAGEAATPAFVAELWMALLATGVSTDIASVRPATALWWAAVALAAVGVARPWARRSPGDRATPPAGRAARERAVGRWSLAGMLLVPPLAVWAATQPRSLFYSPDVEARYLVPFAAPVYVLVAWLLAAFGRTFRGRWAARPAARAVPVLPVLAVLGVALWSLPEHYAGRRLRDDFDTMALAIWTQAEPGDVVLLVSGNRYPLFLHDYGRAWDRAPLRGGDPVHAVPPGRPADDPRRGRPPVVPFPDRGSDPVEAHDWQARLAALVAEHPRVWLVEVEAHLQDPAGRVEAWLDARLERVLSEGYGADALHLFAADGAPPRVTALSSTMPGTAPWRGRTGDDPGDPPALPLHGAPPRVALPGDALRVTVFDDAAASGAPAYHLALGTTRDRTGRLRAVPRGDPIAAARAWADAPGGSGPRRTRLALDIDGRTPSGVHGLRVDPVGGATGLRAAPVTVRAVAPAGGPREALDTTVGWLRLDGYAVRWVRHDRLVVDLYWRRDPGLPAVPAAATAEAGGAPAAAIGPVVFAHLVGPPGPDGDRVWAGQDGPPSSGAWPPPDAGWTVFDRHVLTLAPGAPGGDYELEVGLYDPETGERWPVDGRRAERSGGRVVLERITIRP